MTTSNRSLPVPYSPAPPPAGEQGLSRAVWDELYSIQQALIELDKPTAMSVRTRLDFGVTTAASWQRILVGGTPSLERPGGVWDSTTGTYTCAQEGYYQFICTAGIWSFTTPATKEYFAGLRGTLTPSSGAPRIEYAFDGGIDSVPLTCLMVLFVQMRKGDQVFFDATIVHATKTGTVDTTFTLQVVRTSSL